MKITHTFSLESIQIISVIQVTNVPWGDQVARVPVAGLGVDGVGGVVILQPLGCGLGQEVQDGLPLLQDFQRVVSCAKSLHCPCSIEGSKESSGQAIASGPEGLQGGRRWPLLA